MCGRLATDSHSSGVLCLGRNGAANLLNKGGSEFSESRSGPVGNPDDHGSIKKQVSRSVAKPPLQDEEVKGERKIVRMRKMKKKESLFLSMRKKKKKKNIFLSSSSKSFKSASSFDETMSPTPSPFFDI